MAADVSYADAATAASIAEAAAAGAAAGLCRLVDVDPAPPAAAAAGGAAPAERRRITGILRAGDEPLEDAVSIEEVQVAVAEGAISGIAALEEYLKVSARRFPFLRACRVRLELAETKASAAAGAAAGVKAAALVAARNAPEKAASSRYSTLRWSYLQPGWVPGPDRWRSVCA